MKIRDGKKKIEIQCKDINKITNFVYRNDKIARIIDYVYASLLATKTHF